MSTPEVRIGDKVRITHSNSYEGVVTGVGEYGLDLDGGRYYQTIREGQSVEILERAPKGFKVGDSVKSSDFSLLQHGTVLINPTESGGTPRVVDAERRYLVMNSVDKFPFSYYDDFYFPNFVIIYIPKG